MHITLPTRRPDFQMGSRSARGPSGGTKYQSWRFSAYKRAMASGAASTRGAAQPATGAAPPDVVAEEVYDQRSSDFETRHHTTPQASWETEEALAA